jgi:hypothetical protein
MGNEESRPGGKVRTTCTGIRDQIGYRYIRTIIKKINEKLSVASNSDKTFIKVIDCDKTLITVL